jgi:lipid-A-disaccharide synthase
MAVVGIQEVIKHFPLIRSVYKSLLAEAKHRKPKFALLLDYPDFNLRLAKDLKKLGIKVVYYISPQVWAWRTGRVKLIRRVVDHMLVLFPFEEGFYKDHDVPVSFVGHPLLDELPPAESANDHEMKRRRFGLETMEVVLGLMPGSRGSEIEHHLRTQLETAAILVRKYQDSSRTIRPVLLVAPSLEREAIQKAMGEVNFPIQIIKAEPIEMISLCDVILCASGTATLMVGLMEKPMVIMYRMNALTAWIAKRLVTATKYFGLVNLVMNRRIVPELFQEEANAQRLAHEIGNIIDHPAVYEQMVVDLRQVKECLGSRGATDKVAKVVANFF